MPKPPRSNLRYPAKPLHLAASGLSPADMNHLIEELDPFAFHTSVWDDLAYIGREVRRVALLYPLLANSQPATNSTNSGDLS